MVNVRIMMRLFSSLDRASDNYYYRGTHILDFNSYFRKKTYQPRA